MDGERKEGKEYNYEGRLLYDGGYRNGKKYGIGKIYYNKKNDDIGGFLNGKKNGKRKEYEKNGKLKYEGEYLNGKKNGNGEEYFTGYYKSQIMFDGEYLKNYRYKGKEYYQNGKLKFEGEYLFAEKWNGKEFDYNGNVVFELINGNAIIEDKYDKIKLYIGDNLTKKN